MFIAVFCWRKTPVAKFVKLALPRPAAALHSVEPRVTRNLYPFSVIYGGAYSGEELARARKVDAVVARHYAGFGSATVSRMPKDALMYVSYRRGNQVYWTKAKHRIPKGETVLCDGENLARTRCGNRLSPKPQAPIASGDEPTEEAFDFPDKPKGLLSTPNAAQATTPDADFFIPANPADLLSSLSPFGPVSPPLSPSGNASNVPERPFGAGSFGGAPGPFLGGGVFYPPTIASSGRAFSPASGAIITGAGIATPEPSTLPLLLLGVLLGSPALLHAWQNRADPNVRNN